MSLEINIGNKNRNVTISASVKDSLHASLLADRLNSMPYLKVYERIYKDENAIIKAYSIPAVFSIEKLHSDLDNMSDLIIQNSMP